MKVPMFSTETVKGKYNNKTYEVQLWVVNQSGYSKIEDKGSTIFKINHEFNFEDNDLKRIIARNNAIIKALQKINLYLHERICQS